MIDFIKDYGVSSMDYENIMKNARVDVIECIAISEPSIRDILEYYNDLGVQQEIAKIIITRPDLILISRKNLEDLLSKVNKEDFVNKIKNNIEDLVVLGI